MKTRWGATFPDGRCSLCGMKIAFKSIHPQKSRRDYCSEECFIEGEKENEHW